MKCVIFAGGLGTRLGEETDKIPKPLLDVGGQPLLWHIMKTYSYYGITNFFILAGYKQHLIKDYFHNYYLHNCDTTFHIFNNTMSYDKSKIEDWTVTVVDTGMNTPTGERLKQIENLLNGETFLLTYGDGLSNVDINKLCKCYEKNDSIITLTAIQPEGKYGNLILGNENNVDCYEEKPIKDKYWVNGGYMVCSPDIFDYLQKGDFSNTLKELSLKNKLKAYSHLGFWRSVDTIFDLNYVRKLWDNGEAKWRVWND